MIIRVYSFSQFSDFLKNSSKKNFSRGNFPIKIMGYPIVITSFQGVTFVDCTAKGVNDRR